MSDVASRTAGAPSALRVLLTYGLGGPPAGASLYVALSALAGAAGIDSTVFLRPDRMGETLEQGMAFAGWLIAFSIPLSLSPALLTGWLTWRRVRDAGACPWWLSCLYGALASGPPGLLLLMASRAAQPDLAIIPHPAPGAALIALIGFLGTWPAWRLLPAAYRSSPQKR